MAVSVLGVERLAQYKLTASPADDVDCVVALSGNRGILSPLTNFLRTSQQTRLSFPQGILRDVGSTEHASK